MTTPLFLEGLSRPLLILHALSAMALLGAVTHMAILDVAFLLGRLQKQPLEARYVSIVAWLYPATFLVGALIYPTFRVRVRHEHLDLNATWASNAFDIKENLAALGVLIAINLFWRRRNLKLRAGTHALQAHAVAGLLLATLTWTVVILGLVVTAEEGL